MAESGIPEPSEATLIPEVWGTHRERWVLYEAA